MKNLFQKLSSATTSLKQQFVSKSAQLMTNIKSKVAMLSTVAAVGISQPAIAAEWHKVDTPGIGPRAFAEKHFGTSEWKGNLVCRQGGKDGENGIEKLVINAKTDVPLWGECTMLEKQQPSSIEDAGKKSQPQPTIKAQQSGIEMLNKESAPSPKIQSLQQARIKRAERIERELEKNISKTHYIDLGKFQHIPGITTFNVPVFKKASAYIESLGNPHARAENRNKKGEIIPGKTALGLFQFLAWTAKGQKVTVSRTIKNNSLSINMDDLNLIRKDGGLDETTVQKFAKNIPLQNLVMDSHIEETLEAIGNSPKTIEDLNLGKISIEGAAALRHFTGTDFKKGVRWGRSDGRTPDKEYVRRVEEKYNEYMIQEQAKRATESEKVASVSPITSEVVPSLEKLATGDITLSAAATSTPAANDEKFETPATVETVSHKTSSVVQNIQDRPQSRVRNDQYIMLAAKRDQLIQKATKLELQATKLEKDVQSIVGESWGKRKFLIDIRNYREEAQKLRKHAHTISIAIAPIDTSKKVA